MLCPEARKLFCLNADDGALLGRVDGLEQNPTDVAFSPDGGCVVVSHSSTTGGVSVVDLKSKGSRIVFTF